jgi:hypothetical protein
MRKTTIYIEPEGTTKAELIRQALRETGRGSLRVKPRARGVFRGPADLATRETVSAWRDSATGT